MAIGQGFPFALCFLPKCVGDYIMSVIGIVCKGGVANRWGRRALTPHYNRLLGIKYICVATFSMCS